MFSGARMVLTRLCENRIIRLTGLKSKDAVLKSRKILLCGCESRMILLLLLGETLRAAADGQPELCDGFHAYGLKLALEVVEDRRIRDLAVGGHGDGFLLASNLPIAEAALLPVDFGLALAALNVARVDSLHHGVRVASDGVGGASDGKYLVRLGVAFGRDCAEDYLALAHCELSRYRAERVYELFELRVDALDEVVPRERRVRRIGDGGEERAEAAEGVRERGGIGKSRERVDQVLRGELQLAHGVVVPGVFKQRIQPLDFLNSSAVAR